MCFYDESAEKAPVQTHFAFRVTLGADDDLLSGVSLTFIPCALIFLPTTDKYNNLRNHFFPHMYASACALLRLCLCLPGPCQCRHARPFTFFSFLFIFSPLFIFLRPLSFKEKELENKNRQYLQPRHDTFQLYILPFALFRGPFQLRKRLHRFT